MCYHIEFCCSASKGVRKHGREQPNLGSTGDPAPLRQGEAVLQEIPPDVLPSEFVRFRSNGKALQAYLQRFAWKKKMIHRVPHVETLKVIGTVKDQSATKDFPLTFHSNHSPISYRFRDKQRFRSRIANFPHPRVISCPSEGSRLNFVTALELKRTRMIGLPSWGKVS